MHRVVDVMIVEKNTRDAVLVETFSFVLLLPPAIVIRLSARGELRLIKRIFKSKLVSPRYDSMSDLGEIRVYQRADFQSGSRVLKKVF